MAHIGIAGVTAEGALLCCRTILAAAAELPGPEPEITLHLNPFRSYYDALSREDWPTVVGLLVDSIGKLRDGGADFAIIPANVVHFAFDDVARSAPLPVLSLVEATSEECRRRNYARVAVLGTSWTMRGGLYDRPLRSRGIEPVVPGEAEQQTVQNIIIQELVAGQVREESTAVLLGIVEELKKDGCEAAVLGCTELPLALHRENCGIDVIDTTRLLGETALAHARSLSETGAAG